jgi:ABC-type multidrug transport system fused ATPase/permease subunit
MLHFGGYSRAILALSTASCTQIALIGMTLWLSAWTGAYAEDGATNIGFYLGTYACILLGINIMVPLNNAVSHSGAWIAARTLHAQFTEATLRVPISWFDSHPMGTIMNRFSTDINSLDSVLVNWLRMTLDNQMRLILRIGAIASI